MNVLLDFSTEIEMIRKLNEYGIEVVKGRIKLSTNNYQKGLFIDIASLAFVLDISLDKLLEYLSYDTTVRGNLAYYRNENRVIRLLNVECINPVIRNLAGSGYETALLRTVRDRIYKTVDLLEREVNESGKN